MVQRGDVVALLQNRSTTPEDPVLPIQDVLPNDFEVFTEGAGQGPLVLLILASASLRTPRTA